MNDEPKTQSFINSVNGLIVDVAVVYHTESRQHIVLWSDILNAFPGVANLTIRNGTFAVPLAKYMSYYEITPKCIAYQPNATLTVILGEPVDTTIIEQVNFDYAQSVGFSEVPSDRLLGGRGRFLDLVDEGEVESVQSIEEVTIGMGRIEFGGSSAFEYHQPSSGNHDPIAIAMPAITLPSPNNPFNRNEIDTTPPLSTTSSSESGTGSGVSTSSATNIPPSNIDTAGSGASVTSGTTVVPEPTEIDPVEATSSWASIFRTLGDLQEQYQLTPEETTKMFTEITQSA